MDMYIGALVVIIAAGCVFELLEGAAERRRYQRNAQLVDFPGLNDCPPIPARAAGAIGRDRQQGGA